ncbi:MAG: hypothetical protein ACRD0J_15070 [Acidimicrobiales bacterium]
MNTTTTRRVLGALALACGLAVPIVGGGPGWVLLAGALVALAILAVTAEPIRPTAEPIRVPAYHSPVIRIVPPPPYDWAKEA